MCEQKFKMETLSQRRFLSEFIQMYKSKPELWKIKSEIYKNRIAKNEAYNALVEKCREYEPNTDKEYVKKKINCIRSVYRRELKKVANSRKSGAGADDEYIPSLWYFGHLNFLEDQEGEGIKMEGECVGLPSDNDESESENAAVPQTQQKKKLKAADELLDLASKRLRQSNDGAQTFANTWAFEYRQLTEEQKIYAKKAIDDILFEAKLGNLQRGSVQINKSTTHNIAKPAPVYLSDASTSSSIRSSTPTIGIQNPITVSKHSGFASNESSSFSSQQQCPYEPNLLKRPLKSSPSPSSPTAETTEYTECSYEIFVTPD